MSELAQNLTLPGALLAGLSPGVAAMLVMFASCAAVLGVVALNGMFLVWWERKISAHIQSRVGPMTTGYWHGWLQSIADGVKLLLKENIIPLMADRWLFMLAPLVVFMSAFMAFVPIPWGEKLIVADLNVGVLYIAAITSLSAIGVIMAGWASNNKWSLFATIRTATQMVSYEIPIGLAFIAVVVCSGTFSLQGIVLDQAGWFYNWYIFRNPFIMILAVTYLVASLAECKRAPFDLPEAESELVSGFHTEYSGMRFGLFFLAEYAAMYLVSAIAVVIFFGGWYTGLPFIDDIGIGSTSTQFGVLLGSLIKIGVIVSKAVSLVFIQIWVRWTLPRVRLDQMMFICWKVLTPISMVALVGSTLWELASGGGALFGLLALFGLEG